MSGAVHRVRRWLAHTRFVPTPVYRLMVVSWLISGLLQFVYGAPSSVVIQGPASWFDWAFVIAQLLSAVMLLGGLYLVEGNTAHATRLHRSLGLEFLGIIGLQTVIAVQVVAATFNQGRIPSAGTTWMGIVFAVWLIWRERDILRVVRVLGRRPQ